MPPKQIRWITTSDGHSIAYDDLVDNPGRTYAVEHGNRGRLCLNVPCQRISSCTFLHRKSAQRAAPPQRPVRPPTVSVPEAAIVDLADFVSGDRVIEPGRLLSALERGLSVRCCSCPFLRALDKFLTLNHSDAVGRVILDTETWFCNIDVEDDTALMVRNRELLANILVHVLTRNVNPSMRTLENCRRLIAKMPDQNGDAQQQLLQLCAERERTVLHAQQQRRHQGRPEATRYGDDVVISPDYLRVMPTESDFNDRRSKETIIRACPTLVVDAPIANEQRVAHVSAIFNVYREDYVAKVRQAVQVVRNNVPPNTKVRQGRLPYDVHARLREADPNREVSLYLNLTFTGVSVQRSSGVVYTFKLDPQQFQGRKVNWERKLMNGNLVLLSTAFFDATAPIWYGTIQRQKPPSKESQNAKPVNATLTTFDVCLEDHETLLGGLGEAPSFSALESSAFFVPYQRVLTALQEILSSPTPTLPLEAGLLAGDTNHVPLYLLNRPQLKVGKAVQLRHLVAPANPQQPDATRIDVLDRAQWAARCEPWTAQRETNSKENRQCHFLDPTQLDAAHHIFTHNVAVVQGTPGTGKTFMGAKFAQILLDNFAELQVGPILCVCETNHAVDAFLSDLLCFEPERNVVRVGGSTKDERIATLALFKKLRFNGNREYEDDAESFRQLSKEAHRINQLNPAAISKDDEEKLFTVAQSLPEALQSLLYDLNNANMELSSRRKSLNVQLERECRMYNKLRDDLTKLSNVKANTFAEAKRLFDNRVSQFEKLTYEKHRLRGQVDALLQQEQAGGLPNVSEDGVLQSLSSEIAEMRGVLESAQGGLQRLASLAQKRQQKQQSKKKRQGKGKGKGNQNKNQRGNESEKDADVADTVENQAAVQLKETMRDLEKSIAETVMREKALRDLVTSLRNAEKRLQTVVLTPSKVTEARRILDEMRVQEEKIQRLNEDIAACDKRLSLPVLQRWLLDAPNNSSRGIAAAAATPPTPAVRKEGNHPGAAAAVVESAQQQEQEGESNETWYQRDAAEERRYVMMDDEEQSDEEFTTQELAMQQQKEMVHDNQITLENLCRNDAKQATRANRTKILELSLFFWRHHINQEILDLIRKVERSKAAETKRRNREKANVMGQHRIIGATTAGCALELEAMKLLAPKVIIVEEAAEVLESHVLACLTQRVQHLVLIGDHKQLRPKVEEYLLGVHKNLEVSLMERLVRIGAPYVTLTTQRRMHPEISDFTKLYYRTVVGKGDAEVTVLDHPATELRVPIRGVRDSAARVFFVSHPGTTEQHAEKKHEWMESWCNPYEANLALAIARHLSMCNADASITILCPYSGQLMTTLDLAKRFGIKYHSRASPGGVKIVSVDDYQGEESDIIILSLTRTTEDGFQRGFLKEQNRACVALSRAHCGMYLIGCLNALRSSNNPVWKECIRLVETRGVVSDTFPAECFVHPGENMAFNSIEQQQHSRCSKLCGMPLPTCAHLCQGLCHFGDERHTKCHAPCERTPDGCPSGHKCGKRCCDECGPCQTKVTVVCPTCQTSHQVQCHKQSTFKCEITLTRAGTCNESHQVTAPCYTWTKGTARSHCDNPCGEKMPCTHVCERKCHADDEQHTLGMSKCTKQKTVPHPTCRLHQITVPCSLPVEKYPKCSEPCDGRAACGHPCTSKCHAKPGFETVHRCTGRTSDRHCALCQKTNPFPCDEENVCCPTPCDFVLPCGHTCQGTCGTCKHSPLWYDHQPCSTMCKKVNVCGHQCRGGCTQECPPCGARCDFSCGHGSGCANAKPINRHDCGECTHWKCQSDCDWSCSHYRCGKRCFEPCDRPVCDAVCSREHQRPCGHTDPCLGLCGEASCTEFCPSCFRSAKEEKKASYPPRDRIVTMSIFLMEDEVDDFLLGKLDLSSDETIQANPAALRLVDMRCCDKTMFAGDLDRYIQSKCDPSEEIRLVSCPLCRKPLRADQYRRQGRLIKKRQLQVAAVRQIVQEHQEQVKKAADEQGEVVLQLMLPLLGDDEAQENFADLCQEYDDLPRPPRPVQESKQCQKKDDAAKRFETQMRLWEEANEELSRIRTKIEATVTAREDAFRREHTRSASLRGLALSIALPLWLCVTDSTHEVPLHALSTLAQCVQYCDLVDRLRTPADVLDDALRVITDVLSKLKESMRSGSAFGSGDGQRRDPNRPTELQGLMLQAAMLWTRIVNISVVERERREWQMTSSGLSPSWISGTHQFAQYQRTFEALVDEAKRISGQLPFFRGRGQARFFENRCLHSSCPAFQRFMNGLQSRGKLGSFSIALVDIGFHGTVAEALHPICCRGFDVARRRGQAHGPGEYFAKDPSMSDGYARGAEKMLICAIAKGRPTTEHPFGWVVDNPTTDTDIAFAVPLGVVAYGAARVNEGTPLRCTCPLTVDQLAVQRLHRALLHDFPVDRRPLQAPPSDTKTLERLLQVLDVTKRAVEALEDRCQFQKPSREYLQHLTKALGVTAGHWYQCSSGHLYVIADCGGAMMESRCPECGEVIGGQQHRLVSSSTSAASLVVEGAAAAWPI